MSSPGCSYVGERVLEGAQGLQIGGESMGVALIWSSLFGMGERWDFLPHLQCRQGVRDQIGISHVPPRPVVLQHAWSDAGQGLWATHCPRQPPETVEWDSFCPQGLLWSRMASGGLGHALWSTHAV